MSIEELLRKIEIKIRYKHGAECSIDPEKIIRDVVETDTTWTFKLEDVVHSSFLFAFFEYQD